MPPAGRGSGGARHPLTGQRTRSVRGIVAGISVAMVGLTSVLVGAPTARAQSTQGYQRACPLPRPGYASCFAEYQPGSTLAGTARANVIQGFTPQQLQVA